MQTATKTTTTTARGSRGLPGASGGKWLAWAAGLIWLTLLAMVAVIAITLPGSGGFAPDVPVGWPNRLVMLAYSFWLIVPAGTADDEDQGRPAGR